MFRFAANRAFKRTLPHPADAHMRVTYDEADVLAVLSKKARGVILKGGATPELMAACRDFTQAVRPALYGSGVQLPANDQPVQWPAEIGQVLREDCMLQLWRLKNLFGRSAAACEANFVVEKQSDMQPPHYDASFSSGTRIAMIKAYADTKELMTLWYPGARTFAESREVGAAFARVTDRAAFLQSLNAQQLDPGDVMFFKLLPEKWSTNPDECLLHGRPVIGGGITRASFFGTI